MEKETVKGYKVFNPDWTCREKQYTCPGKFEENVRLSLCKSGMHFCKRAIDCFNYYAFNPDNHIAEVIAYGDLVERDDKCATNKCATNKLEIVRELSWEEVLSLVNTGRGCSGRGNSGNQNSGDCNSGNWNSGDNNSGDRNSGDNNSGNWNSGDCNSGDWNETDYSNGCFNTVAPKIYLFNKPSDWTFYAWRSSKAFQILSLAPDKIRWISWVEMTEAERKEHPEAEETGGYIKTVDNSTEIALWWRSLSILEKATIEALPNFDKAIFRQITGIDVDETEEPK